MVEIGRKLSGVYLVGGGSILKAVQKVLKLFIFYIEVIDFHFKDCVILTMSDVLGIDITVSGFAFGRVSEHKTVNQH